jgi:hypothetical protein
MAAAGITYQGIGRNNLALLAPQHRVQPERQVHAEAVRAEPAAADAAG